MLRRDLQQRRDEEELDEAELFDAAGDVEPAAARRGLYPIAGDSGEESEEASSDGEELDFDDVPAIHTPPNPELRHDGRVASSWAAGALDISLGRADKRGVPGGGGWPVMAMSVQTSAFGGHAASLSNPIFIPPSSMKANPQRVEGFGAAFEDPLFADQAPVSPDCGAEAFLPPHEFVRAKLEQSAPVAGFFSHAERGVRVLHTRNAIMRATGFLENRKPESSSIVGSPLSPSRDRRPPVSALTRTFDADMASSVPPKRTSLPGLA